MPGEDAIREQVRRLLATADGFSFDGLEPHDYQKHASVVLDMIRPLVFALGQYQALELGTPEGRISAKCEDSTHPVWLRDLDDMRGCPWCRVAELEGQANCPSQMTVSSGTSQCALLVRHNGDHRNGEKNHYWSDEYADAARVRPTEDEDSHEAKVAEYLSTPYTDDVPSQREAGAL
ncbi:hypothetical protein OG323_06505 [Streptomyces cyaneofuscatus]|uniref:hypothetical protein n=1 Tax=Streptomyces cyaneofuscatus TaxID=66883 RepID=UPI003863709C|nr:hypothetical protein OG323_06505 [Streptomyces cyaneofuscatus]